MGLIPKVDQASPAFIHVDVDDFWAITECYGISAPDDWKHHVSQTALPRFRKLFGEFGIQATFFVVGRDLESPAYTKLTRELLSDGHQIGNHSYSHSLRFRALGSDEMAREIDQCHGLVQSKLGISAKGFRAPGYGWSRQLIQLLDQRSYRYDASLMPGPYGGVFRWMDERLRKKASQDTDGVQPPTESKTQYPLLSDTWNSLYPSPVSGTGIVEIPSSTSGLLRLPFQAGVCMRLGWPYFRACYEPFRLNRALPFVFLFHAADLADFSAAPGQLFRQSSFFNTPIEKKLALARRLLETITRDRPIITTEEWLG